MKKNFILWLTGLPGAGKSTIAKKTISLLERENVKVEYLELDRIRKLLTPNAKYTEEERELVYRSLVILALFLAKNNLNVLIDATAHRKKWRNFCRKETKKVANFVEVYIKCPLETCILRETKRKNSVVVRQIYKKALERLKTGKIDATLGEVVGIDVPYEEPKNPEITIDSISESPTRGAYKIYEYLKSKKFL